jgi:hypothetical protein
MTLPCDPRRGGSSKTIAMRHHITSARRHRPQALEALEFACFGLRTWTSEQIRGFLDEPRNGGLVAIRLGEPIGHLLWSFDSSQRQVRVKRLAVHPNFRWPYIARQLVGTMLQVTTPPPFVPPLTWRAVAADDQLDWHLLLRDLGFRAVQVVRKWRPGVDAYDFQRSSEPAPTRLEGAWPLT